MNKKKKGQKLNQATIAGIPVQKHILFGLAMVLAALVLFGLALAIARWQKQLPVPVETTATSEIAMNTSQLT